MQKFSHKKTSTVFYLFFILSFLIFSMPAYAVVFEQVKIKLDAAKSKAKDGFKDEAKIMFDNLLQEASNVNLSEDPSKLQFLLLISMAQKDAGFKKEAANTFNLAKKECSENDYFNHYRSDYFNQSNLYGMIMDLAKQSEYVLAIKATELCCINTPRTLGEIVQIMSERHLFDLALKTAELIVPPMDNPYDYDAYIFISRYQIKDRLYDDAKRTLKKIYDKSGLTTLLVLSLTVMAESQYDNGFIIEARETYNYVLRLIAKEYDGKKKENSYPWDGMETRAKFLADTALSLAKMGLYLEAFKVKDMITMKWMLRDESNEHAQKVRSYKILALASIAAFQKRDKIAEYQKTLDEALELVKGIVNEKNRTHLISSIPQIFSDYSKPRTPIDPTHREIDVKVIDYWF